MKRFTLVVPTITKDIQTLLCNIDLYFEFLPIKSICVIASLEVREMLPADDRLRFILENDLINYDEVKELIKKRAGEDAAKRTGWYVQQFIKLAYCRYTDDEYYLLWDSDTVPVRKIDLLSRTGIPYMDYKTEYHKPYFDTIGRLLPNHSKEFNGSFISEHMLINSKMMREMLSFIESNNGVKGDTFIEKIIYAIEIKELSESGFSEFETYGTYIYKNHREAYDLRQWHSMRYGGFFYDGSRSLTKYVMLWLAEKYDAISFEKRDSISVISELVQKESFMKYFGSSSLDSLAVFIRAFRKLTRKR